MFLLSYVNWTFHAVCRHLETLYTVAQKSLHGLTQSTVTLFSHWYAKWLRGFNELHLADQAYLVQMLITLGPHGIFCSNCVYLCILIIVQPLVCKTVTRLH